MRNLGGLTVDSQFADDGTIIDVFYIGNGPCFREVATIRQDADGWYRAIPVRGLGGVWQDYRSAFLYVMKLDGTV